MTFSGHIKNKKITISDFVNNYVFEPRKIQN